MLSRINEEFHSAGSGLCDNCPRRRLEVRKIIYAISDCANLCLKRESVSRERANSIDNSCKRSEKYFRSSRLQMFFKTSVLKNFANFTGKHLGWSLFLLKLQACNFIKNRLQHRGFPVKFAKFLTTAFVKNRRANAISFIVIVLYSF